MTIHLPEDLARALKVRAAEELTTLTAIIVRALEEELKKGGRTEKK